MTETSSDFRERNLRDREKRRKLELIRAAAAALMSDRDFDDITTREVAEMAGVGEATLFRHIGSKSELLLMVYGAQMDAVIAEIEAADDATAQCAGTGGRQIIDRVYAIYRRRCEFYSDNPANASRYLREGFRVDDSGAARNMAQGDRTIALTRRILATGQHSGTIRSDVDPAIVAQNCHGTFVHEIDRTPVRHFDPDTLWTRLLPRLEVQLGPLITAARSL